jgi:molybdopterin-binding protein
MTRTQVCQRLGIAPKSLYLWEKSGRIRKPRRDGRGWRQYSEADVKALRALLGRGEDGPAARAGTRVLDGLSARNQLRGTVVAVRGGGVLSEVVLRLGDGQEITAVITRRSVEQLGLRRGREAVAVIKSTEVMLFR